MSPTRPVPERLPDRAALLAATGDDAYARAWTAAGDPLDAWRHPDGAVGWVRPSHREGGRAILIALGPAPSAAALLTALLAAGEVSVAATTLPRGAMGHLADAVRPAQVNEWEWFAADRPPPVQPGEAAVGWLGDAGVPVDGEADEVVALLRRWSPRHDVAPGAAVVRRWCGVRDPSGELVATAAETVHVADVPFLASVATHGERRGQGLGAAVTAWLTRVLLAEGRGPVTLGMYSDNDVARRLYLRLGYRRHHEFSSGRLPARP